MQNDNRVVEYRAMKNNAASPFFRPASGGPGLPISGGPVRPFAAHLPADIPGAHKDPAPLEAGGAGAHLPPSGGR